MDVEQIKSWILEQSISDDVKAALRAGHIVLEPPNTKSLLVVPYRVVDTSIVPRYFHDYGRGYLHHQDDEWLSEHPEAQWAGKLSGGEYVFKWNECKDLNPFCNTGALVEIKATDKTATYSLRVRVNGPVISQSSPWISPQWTQSWLEPFVEVKCGQKSQRFKLASSIGYRRKYATHALRPLIWGNNSLLAPLDREFSFSCPDRPSGLKVGREGSEIETIYEVNSLPAQSLELNEL